MKRAIKIILGVAVVFVLFIVTVCSVVVTGMSSQVKAFDTTPVDVSKVADGVYEGHSETDLVKVGVRVTVAEGKIADIEILKHECGKGKPAEDMLPDMIKENSVEVDAISEATFSSAVIKDAIRKALRNGERYYSMIDLTDKCGENEDMTLYELFEEWLDSALCQDVQDDVIAFNFNLYEDAGSKWSIEIVGTLSFDENDEDWACDEVTDFNTRENPLQWQEDTSWEDVLSKAEDMIIKYLETGKYAYKLKHADAVACGFVDGSLEIVYKR